MRKSAIILAGGVSNRFGQDKGLLRLGDRPLILRILDKVSTVVDEVLVIVNSVDQKEDYTCLDSTVEIVVDKCRIQSPVVGALTGFERAQGEYSLLLPCDTPFVSREVAEFLLRSCVDHDAAIPRWPKGHVEPLQAAYLTKSALTASKKALQGEKISMHLLISYLEKVLYVSTTSIKQMDPKLMTFLNINSPEDLGKAEGMLHANLRKEKTKNG